MASSLLGKRKRNIRETVAPSKRSHSPSSSSESDAKDDLQDIFRRHFEAQFKPLDVAVKPTADNENISEEELGEELESDWEGIGDEDVNEHGVEVVEHTAIQRPKRLSKAELKAYMSSKPPPSDQKMLPKPAKAAQPSEDDEKTDKLNLKNDLALQRLINESHLLDPSKASSSSGQRQKIMDLRLKALGSKSSILQQEKMPMSHRKGIVAKAKDKEAKRRQEAKENGIILERVTRVKNSEEKRLRGVTGPAVGKFKGGTLRLNKRDIADITGPKKFKRR